MEDKSFNIIDEKIFKLGPNGDILAEITFPETEPGVFTINHTFVDSSLRGQGVADKLVQLAIDEIKRRGGEVRATCTYAVGWLEKKEKNMNSYQVLN